MRLTGTFLDEISFDIPHQNWGFREWDRDFAAMKAIGIRRVILIRCANGHFMTYDSQVIPRLNSGCAMHRPPVDLVDMFLTLAEKYEMEFFFGTMHCHPGSCVRWSDPELVRRELEINRAIIAEVQERYGDRQAFRGWYLTHEICRGNAATIELLAEQARFAKQASGGKPTLISPYFAGVKQFSNSGAGQPFRALTVEEHTAEWRAIFSQLAGLLDYVAFQDGHVDYGELADYHRATRLLADEFGIEAWSNIETFDRDMPIKFLPIKWEKFLWKLEAAEAAGLHDAITFEFSHFMSPYSMYPSARGLYDRYCEHFGIVPPDRGC